jgi:uncharacterized membrane protein
MRHLRRSFLTGLLIVLPVVVAVWLLKVILYLLTEAAPRVLAFVWGRVEFSAWQLLLIRVLVLIVMVVGITLVGAFATRSIGGRLTRVFERVLERIPLFNTIYRAFREITVALLGRNRQVLKKVVLVEYPRRGMFVLGFVTNATGMRLTEAILSTFELEPCDLVQGKPQFTNIFVPTSPNPTTGFLAVVPNTSIYDAPVTVEGGLKLIISGGAVGLEEAGSVEQPVPVVESPR